VQLRNYRFGRESYNDYVTIEAFNLAHAIRLFKNTILFPERYVAKKFIASEEYNSKLKRSVYTIKGDNPFIQIRDHETKKLLGKVLLSECMDLELDLNVSTKLLTDGIQPQPNNNSPEQSEGLQLIGVTESPAVMGKQALQETQDALMLKKHELEALMQQVNASMDLLRDELTRKGKILLAIEAYMGLKEEVIQLHKGKSAPEEEPLHVYQQILYMDEEVGLWEDGGLDWQGLDTFDEWIVKNVRHFLYKEKSVVAFKVRRADKKYFPINDIADAICHNQMNEQNHFCYLLIRNGENIYRIWLDLAISEKLFPSQTEYQSIIERYEGYGEDYLREKLQDNTEQYMWGLVALQGLIVRTNILGSTLSSRVNLFSGKFTPKDVVLIRDAETSHWISDGRPNWQEYCKQNRTTIHQGSRIVISSEISVVDFGRDNRGAWRVAPFKTDFSPLRKELYIVEKFLTPEDKKKLNYQVWNINNAPITIYYCTNDTMYSRWAEDHTRIRRVPCRLYLDEVLNFDTITLDDCDYYMGNRMERPRYLSIMPVLYWIRQIRRKEQEVENHFKKLASSQLGWDETRFPEIQEAINWWKLKNKWKRNLMKDDAKALRMIIRRLKKEI
jgi:hypothetical protein